MTNISIDKEKTHMNNNPETPLLKVQNLKKYYETKKNSQNLFKKNTPKVKAVDDISFQIYRGETFGLVGESGCGKSTVGRSVMRLINFTSGEAILKDKDIFKLPKKEFKKIQKDIQMIFQDPYSSLNPRKRIGKILEEPLNIHSIGNKKNRYDIVIDILEKVGMRVDHYYRHPHELSGGQRQRIGLARSLIANPELIIADEPVSALDVSVQSQIINLLQSLQDNFKLTYLFISHDISVVRHISDRIGVMYLGKLVEEAPANELLRSPLHPYTEALLSSIPIPNPEKNREKIILKGDLPSPLSPPRGCVFHTRCPYAMDICKKEIPEKKEIHEGHHVACHLHN